MLILRNVRRITAITMVSIMLILMVVPNAQLAIAATAIEAYNDPEQAWPASFTPYTDRTGNIYYDRANEPGVSPDDVDFTSGARRGVGNEASFYVAGDGSHLFFRMRLLGDPRDDKGGYLSSVWLVGIAEDGVTKATVGVNGKSPHEDYIYVTNANGSVIEYINKTDSSGTTVPGARVVEDTNGDYFLDFQVPISRLTEIDPDLTSSSILQFSFATSKAANLSVVNKDDMGGEGVQVKISPFAIYSPNIALDLASSYTVFPTTISGTTVNVQNASQVTLTVTSTTSNSVVATHTASVADGAWNVTGLAGITAEGSYIVNASVVNENEDTAAVSQQTSIGAASLTITGASSYSAFSFPTSFAGTYSRIDNGARKVNLKVYPLLEATPIITILNINVTGGSQGAAGSWNTTVSHPVELVAGKTYKVEAVDANNATLIATQTITYLNSNIAIAMPENNTRSMDTTPVVSGTANPYDQVELYVDDQLLREIEAGADGTWSVEVDRALAPTPASYHEFKAMIGDGNGNTRQSVVNYGVDSLDISMENDAHPYIYINNLEPTIRGRSTDTSVNIEVTEVGNSANSFTMLAVPVVNTKWSIKVPTANRLNDNMNYTVVAATNQDSTVIATLNLRVKSSTFVTITSPAPGSSLSADGSIVGQSEPGAIIDLNMNNSLIAQATADTNGDWAYTPSINWIPGAYGVIATTSDEVGNTASTGTNFLTGVTITTVNVNGDSSIAIPASGNVSETYTAVVKDESDSPISNANVTWSLQSDVTGVSINATTGVVTVSSSASGGATVTVVATSVADSSKSGSKAVTLSNEAPTAVTAAVYVYGASSITIPTTISVTQAYTATVKDQFDNTMDGADVTWSLQSDVTGVSINAATGVVTVSSSASGGANITIVATSGGIQGSIVVVLSADTSEADVVEATKNLGVRYQQSDIWESVTLPVFLLKDGANSTDVSWQSNKVNILSIEEAALQDGQQAREYRAIVNRSGLAKDASVILTATVSKNGVSRNRTFLIIVKSESIEDKVTKPRDESSVIVNGEAVPVGINRSVLSNQNIVDKLIVTDAAMVQLLLNSDVSELRLEFNDTPTNNARADLLAMDISSDALLRMNNKKLHLATPEGAIVLTPGAIETMKNEGIDLNFYIVPIRQEVEKQDTFNRVLQDPVVTTAAGSSSVEALDIPRRIETNYTGISTDVIVPLTGIVIPTNPTARQQFLDSLRIFIEHSDGDKRIVRTDVINDGTIINDGLGNPVGIQFTISKFSTFTLYREYQPTANVVTAVTPSVEDILIQNPVGDNTDRVIDQPIKVAGTAGDNQTIVIYLDGEEIAQTVSDAAGSWEYTLNKALEPGVYILHAESTSSGSKRMSNLVNFTIYPKVTHFKYISGYPDGEFKPDRFITRAEMAAMMATIIGRTSKPIQSSYSDVSSKHWAFSPIEVMMETGIMKGYEDGKFYPSKEITRGEMAVVISNYLNLTRDKNLSTFSYADTNNHWARYDIELLRELGIMSGYDDGLFYPKRSITRAEAVITINSTLKRGGLYGEYAPSWPDVSQDHWAYAHIQEASRPHEAFDLEHLELWIRFTDE